MKKLLWLLLLIPALSFADTSLNDVICLTGSNAYCSSPAPGFKLLTFSPLHGRLVLTTVSGKVYDSGQNSATPEGGILYASDGSAVKVVTTYAIWLTQTKSGKGTQTVEHWELKEGSITAYSP